MNLEILYSRQAIKRPWDNIEEVNPDEWDNYMLHEILENPECHDFVSSKEAMAELNIKL